MPHASILTGLHYLRRRATRSALQATLAITGRLRPALALGLGRTLGRVAGLPGPWRMRLACNMRAAGIEPNSTQIDRYFRLLGHWFGRSMAVYNRGFADSGVADLFDLSDPDGHLKAALGQG